MEEFTAYTVERIKGKKQLVFNISIVLLTQCILHLMTLKNIVTIYVIGTIYMTKNN